MARAIDMSAPRAYVCDLNSRSLGLFLTLAAERKDFFSVVTEDSQVAESAVEAVVEWRRILELERTEPVLIPELQGERRSWMPENEALLASAMSRAWNREKNIFIGSAVAFMNPAPPPEEFVCNRFILRRGEEGMSPETLAERLTEIDYDCEVEVRVPGEFSRRGGIVDVFSPLCEYPARLEFFGDEIESMRLFDPETQRSLREIEEFEVAPRGECILGGENTTTAFQDYLDPEANYVIWRPERIEEHLQRFGGADWRSRWDDFREKNRPKMINLIPPEEKSSDDSLSGKLNWRSLDERAFFTAPELDDQSALVHWQMLRANLRRWHAQQVKVVAACGSEGEAERLQEMLDAEGPAAGNVEVLVSPLQSGLTLPELRLVILGEKEIFGVDSGGGLPGRVRAPYRADYRGSQEGELSAGDYAVHAAQGIAVYHGVREIENNGLSHEVIELEFADDARLYVPIEQSWLISRYIGTSRKRPKLSRIGDASWKKAREAAADSAYDLAAELIRIEALRKNAPGFSFLEDPHWERPFAASFPYIETADQSRAIKEVLADMERPEPMDRLLCGDVGYGKTEVAMRAAFRAVANGRQTAVLVPTTLLAQQHFHAFRQRMIEYPVNIEMLSRFRTEAEQRRILERVSEGGVDILIGTHRLLRNDVVFHDLGLIVIDEEQRFGVKDKEKLKRMRARVDILTMTATPIPRTLYFSLSGIRNLSTIMTPPEERLPVKTVVARAEDELLRRAVLRELERSGQVFFLHNRVHSIEAAENRLREIVPEARTAVAHGRMRPAELEQAMQAYLRKEVDVLVCTTIIESGLDIPNANTIIIQDADRFGLAELYQLRGRVGRYHHQAYAYLLLSPLGMPARNARDRLAAIRQYASLGAGMNLALRDLEIRGAGNILGTRQSGHIAAVGFDFYCELLQEAVARLKNEPRPKVGRSVSVFLPGIQIGGRTTTGGRENTCVAADFPSWYIEAEQLRLNIYRRLSKLRDGQEWEELRRELQDRFGPLPEEAENMMRVALLRMRAAAKNVFSVSVRDDRLLLETENGLLKDRQGKLPRLAAEEPLEQLNEIVDYLA